jgi:hypothetical protein
MKCPRFSLPRHLGGVLLLTLCSINVLAAATAEQVARLGKDLTPVGAERAGNKDGTIPAWTGGLTKAPAGFDPNKGHLDPFAADKPLFTISAANAEQYKDKLAPGQLAMLKRYPSYKMLVYPTRRSAGYPDELYANIAREARTAEMSNGGDTVTGVRKSSVPFPVPVAGQEAVLNHLYRSTGGSVQREIVEFPVNTDGSFTPVRRMETYVDLTALVDPPENLRFVFRTIFTSPSNIAGQAILVFDGLDQVKQDRNAWVYNPGSRRVLRAPSIAYDSPRDGVDGLSTIDDYDGFNGRFDRYDFKLVGKREMFVSYHNYRLVDKSLKYKDIVKQGTLNQDLVRYELHRVWVVEATLKPGKSHVYAKRLLYIDEDSWQIAHYDAYDGRGELWRVFEGHAIQFYDAPTQYYAGTAQYDLQARRYVASALTNEEKPYRFRVPYKLSDYTADALRRMGN